MTINLRHIHQETIRTLDAQVGELYAEFAPQMQCRKGCSSCCENTAFKIRYIEALHLLEGYRVAPPEVQAAILANVTAPSEESKNHCPVLVEGACALYAHRPALCRAYGLILKKGEDISTCPLNFNDPPPDSGLKALDLDPYYDVLDELSERAWACGPHAGFPESPEAPRDSIRGFLTRLLRGNQGATRE